MKCKSFKSLKKNEDPHQLKLSIWNGARSAVVRNLKFELTELLFIVKPSVHVACDNIAVNKP